ncbi:MAG: hypothetical protein M3P51_15930 [Chloroflexota bacterium]|nr:hypothetical protein [Chloroflexota bacterium]
MSIGSPHLGGPLAWTGRNALYAATSAMAYGLTSGCSGIVGITCTRPYFLATAIVPFLVGLGADVARPAFIDMRPGSDFENATNATPESFPRVGIQSYSKRLFVEWRLYGDAKSGPDDIIDGGKYQVRAAWGAVVSNTACGAVGWMINRGDIAAHCGKRVVLLFAMTGLWNVLASGLDRNDGIVPGRSQVWPFNPGSSGVYRNYGIPDGDSHVGETKSTKVRRELRNALAREMGVEIR